MYMTQGALTAPTIRLKPEANTRLKEAFGVDTETAIALHIGVDQGHYNRVKNGQAGAGPQFQARLLLATAEKGLTFYDLFEIVPDTAPDAQR